MRFSILRLLAPAFLASQAWALAQPENPDFESDVLQKHCHLEGSTIKCNLPPNNLEYGTGMNSIMFWYRESDNHKKNNKQTQRTYTSTKAQQKTRGEEISSKINDLDENIQTAQFLRRIRQYRIDKDLKGSEETGPEDDSVMDWLQKSLENQRELTMQFSVLHAVHNWSGVRKKEMMEFCQENPSICELGE